MEKLQGIYSNVSLTELVKTSINTCEGSINVQVMAKVYIFSQEISIQSCVHRKPRGKKHPASPIVVQLKQW